MRAGGKTNFELRNTQFRCGEFLGNNGSRQLGRTSFDCLVGGAYEKTVAEKFIKIAAALRLESGPDDGVGIGRGRTGQTCEHFEFVKCREERLDHRLHGHQRAVERASIPPAFEIVRSGDVEVCSGRCLVDSATDINALGGLSLCSRPVKIDGCVVNWIATEHDECLDVALAEASDCLGDARISIRHFQVANRGAKGFIDRNDDGVHGLREVLTSHDDGMALICRQIGGALFDPLGIDLQCRSGPLHIRGQTQAQRSSDLNYKCTHLTTAQP